MAELGPCVLPSLRLARLREDVRKITDDGDKTNAVMDAIEKHLEADSMRWGNACPIEDCQRLLVFEYNTFRCPQHGLLWSNGGTILLIGYRPVTTEVR